MRVPKAYEIQCLADEGKVYFFAFIEVKVEAGGVMVFIGNVEQLQYNRIIHSIDKEIGSMLQAIVLFLLAGIAEIGGGYFIWLWLRKGSRFIGEFLAGWRWHCTVSSLPFSRFYHLAGCMLLMAGCLLFFPYYGDGSLIRKRRIGTIGLAR